MNKSNKIILIWSFCILLSTISVLATSLDIYVRPLTSGAINTNTSYSYNFAFVKNPDCTPIILNVSSNIVTDSYGIGYAELDITSMKEYPSYMCEYKNGTLRTVHEIGATLANVFYLNDAVYLSNTTFVSNSTEAGSSFYQQGTGNIANFSSDNGWMFIDNEGNIDISGHIKGENLSIISYKNISDIPTCAGTDKLTYDGIDLVCAVDQTGGSSSKWQTDDEEYFTNDSTDIFFDESLMNTTVDEKLYAILATYANKTYALDTVWAINTTVFANASGTLNLVDGGIRITESQITNLQSYLTSYSETDPIFIADNSSIWSGIDSKTTLGAVYTLLTTYANTSDVTTLASLYTILNSYANESWVTSGFIAKGTKIGNSSAEIQAVTYDTPAELQAIYYPTLSTYVNTTDLSYTVDTDNNWPINVTVFTNASGTLNLADGGIRITESQITDLGSYLTSESDVAAIALLTTYANTSDIYVLLDTYVNSTDLAYIQDTLWVINTTDFENTSGTLELNHTSLEALFLEKGIKIGNSSDEIKAIYYPTLSTYVNSTDLAYTVDTNTNWLINTTVFENASGTLNLVDGGIRITESQISDLGSYLTSENDAIAIALLGTYVNTTDLAYIPDTNTNWPINTTLFTNASGTLNFKDSGLRITESQVTDLQAYLTSESDSISIGLLGTYANTSDVYTLLDTYVNTTDLDYTVDTNTNWPINTTVFANATGTLNLVDGGIRITESQITDLQAYLTSETDATAIGFLSTYANTSDVYVLLNTYANESWVTSGFIAKGTKIGNSSAEIRAIYYPTLQTYANKTDIWNNLDTYSNTSDIYVLLDSYANSSDVTTISTVYTLLSSYVNTSDLSYTLDTQWTINTTDFENESGMLEINQTSLANTLLGLGDARYYKSTVKIGNSSAEIQAVYYPTLDTYKNATDITSELYTLLDTYANSTDTVSLATVWTELQTYANSSDVTDEISTTLSTYMNISAYGADLYTKLQTYANTSDVYTLLSTYANSTDLASYVIIGDANKTLVSYNNITDIPTCTGSNKLTFNGTTLLCAADVEGEPGATYDLNVTGDTGDIAIENGEILNFEGGTGIVTAATGSKVTITAINSDTLWNINTTMFDNASGTLNLIDGAIRITESQITDLGSYLTSESDTIAIGLLSTYANSSDVTSDIYTTLSTYVNSTDLAYIPDTNTNWIINTTDFENTSGTLELNHTSLAALFLEEGTKIGNSSDEIKAIYYPTLSTYVNTTDLTYTVDTDNNWPINISVFTNASGTLNLKDTGIRITESQITDLGSYLTVETDAIAIALLSTYVNSTDIVTDTNTNWPINTTLFTNASGTLNFKDGGLRIIESQITDLQSYLTSESDSIAIGLLGTYVNSSDVYVLLDTYVNTTDLDYTVDTDNNWPINTTVFANATGTLNLIDGGIRITESQVTDLQAYLTAETDASAIALLGTYANTSDVYVLLNTYANESWVTSGFVATGTKLGNSSSEIQAIYYPTLSTYVNSSDLAYIPDTDTQWTINTTDLENQTGTLGLNYTRLSELYLDDGLKIGNSSAEIQAVYYPTLSTYVNSTDLAYIPDTNTNWVINTTDFENTSGTLELNHTSLNAKYLEEGDLDNYITEADVYTELNTYWNISDGYIELDTYINESDVYALVGTYANTTDLLTLATVYSTLETYANSTDVYTLLDTYVNSTDIVTDTNTNWLINTSVFTNASGTLNLKDSGIRITESQITDLGSYLTSESDATAIGLLSTYANTSLVYSLLTTYANSTEVTSDIYITLDTYMNTTDLAYIPDTNTNWPINTTVFANASGTLNLVDSGIIITESQISNLGSYLTVETDAIAIALLSTYANTSDITYTIDTHWDINSTLFENQSGTLGFVDTGLKLTESQITDLQSYLTTESDVTAIALLSTYANTSDVYVLLDTYVNTTDLAYIPDTNTNWIINTTLFTNSSGTLNFKDGGLRLTESQITDLGSYLTSESDTAAIALLNTYANTSDVYVLLDTYANTSDVAAIGTVYTLLSTYVNATDIITDTNTNWPINTTLFTNASGTLNFKDSGLRIVESQITNLGSYLTSESDPVAYTILGTYSNTTDIYNLLDTYVNETGGTFTGDITFSKNISIGDSVVSSGDVDTYIDMATSDVMKLYAGGDLFITMDSSGAPSMVFNNVKTGNSTVEIQAIYYPTLDTYINKSDVYTELNTYLNKTGGTMSGDLDMGSKNITTVDCIVFAGGGKICDGT